MKKLFLTLAISLLVFGVTFAQGGDDSDAEHGISILVPSIALVDIEGGGDITLDLDASSTEAGDNPLTAAGTNSELWLNYTSIIDADNSDRTISVQLDYTADVLPAGLDIILTPTAGTNAGVGGLGTMSATPITLANATQLPVVTGVTSCYTGNGADYGINLVYSLSITNTSFITTLDASADYSATITYTISDL